MSYIRNSIMYQHFMLINMKIDVYESGIFWDFFQTFAMSLFIEGIVMKPLFIKMVV